MKNIGIILAVLILSFSVLVGHSYASAGKISVTTSKSGSTITAYVKNFDNSKTKKVVLELQKDSKTTVKRTLWVKADKQVKQTFKLNSKGKYRIKYTSDGKTSYTTTYNHK